MPGANHLLSEMACCAAFSGVSFVAVTLGTLQAAIHFQAVFLPRRVLNTIPTIDTHKFCGTRDASQLALLSSEGKLPTMCVLYHFSLRLIALPLHALSLCGHPPLSPACCAQATWTSGTVTRTGNPPVTAPLSSSAVPQKRRPWAGWLHRTYFFDNR